MAILLKTASDRVSSIQIMQVRVQNKGKSVWKSRYDGDVSHSKLNCEEKRYLVSFIEDVEAFKTSHSISPNYTRYVPLVHKLLDGNFIAKNLVRFC